MQIEPLTAEEAAYHQATHRCILTSADLAALTGGTGAQAVNIFLAPQGCLVNVLFAKLATNFTFSDGTLTSCAVVVGDTNSTNRFVTSYELTNAPYAAQSGVALSPGLFQYTTLAGTQVEATFTPTGGKNLNTCTAGELHVYFTILGVPPLAG